MFNLFFPKETWAGNSDRITDYTGFSQAGPSDHKNSCDLIYLGLFRQITNASFHFDEGFSETYEATEETEVRENLWKLSTLDEMDPAYKIYLTRDPLSSGKEKCGSTIEAFGKLISPTGKVFDLKQASYCPYSRSLRLL